MNLFDQKYKTRKYHWIDSTLYAKVRDHLTEALGIELQIYSPKKQNEMIWKLVVINYTCKHKIAKNKKPVCPLLHKALSKDTIDYIQRTVTNPTKKSRDAFFKDPFIRQLWEKFVEEANVKDCF